MSHRLGSARPRFWAFFAACLFTLISSLHSSEPVALSGRAMGTTWAVKFVQPTPPLDPEVVKARVAGRLEQLEQQFSTYRPSSELSRFNRSTSTDWVAVSPELALVAARSRRISELTDGAFDVTVAPLVDLWGFGPAGRIGSLPSDLAITEARARVGFRWLEVRSAPPGLRKTATGVMADFSSMAKGFTADTVGALLVSLGITDHLAQVGGDTVAHGHPADLPGWRVGIESPQSAHPAAHPAMTPAAISRVVTLSGQALSTSGGAHNFTLIDGHRYSHIIDPATGRPADSALVSVSVIADSCAESSAWATALFVLGPERGQALAAREHLAARFLIRTGSGIAEQTTKGFTPPASVLHP